VRAWRAQHETQILRELFDLVAIPNAADKSRHRAQRTSTDADVRAAPLSPGHDRNVGLAGGARRTARAECHPHAGSWRRSSPSTVRPGTCVACVDGLGLGLGQAGGPIVRLPTIGGSAPFYVFTDVLKVPTFGLSIVNFDNNQHGANENLRIKNLWEGIDSMAARLTMP
jgi:hypothetical protein